MERLRIDWRVATVSSVADETAHARTLVLDPKTRRAYLPSAEYEAPKDAPKDAPRQRPAMKPGTFKIIVVAP